MTFRIHFELPDGSELSVVVTGYDIEEVQHKANAEVKKRGGKNPWSEEVT